MRLVQLVTCIVLVCCSSTACRTADAGLRTTEVERYDVAVAKAVKYLRSMTVPIGQPPSLDSTSLVAYALLKAGVDLREPQLAGGIASAVRRARAAQYDQYHGRYLAAVDAMLLADIDPKKYRKELQKIANMIAGYQRPDGSWHDPGMGLTGPADTSLIQYCVLGLWAAKRAGCRVSPSVFDRTAEFLTEHPNADGGWAYRITGPTGEGTGESTHNMTMAAIGTIGISRLLLFPEKRPDRPKKRFGVLERVDEEDDDTGYSNYKPKVQLGAIEAGIERGQKWNEVRFSRVPPDESKIYFYYTLERAATLTGMQENWFTTYGDGLLTLQHADGYFDVLYGPAIDTSLAILYYMRSTQQILGYGRGLQTGYRDLQAFIYGDPKAKQKEATPLEQLLEKMADIDVSSINVDTDEVVEKIKFSSREELVGHADKLRTMLKSPDATDRQIAYWALSRTADFDLVPLLLDGLHDPDLNVSIEALTGLRYIARRPKGFNLSLQPLSRLPDDADEAMKLNAAQIWKDKASRVWRQWYSGVRPYAERDGLDEVGLPVDRADR